MLHYNFPPFSVGEVAVPARPRPPRSGPRRAGRARARADGARRREVPLHIRIVSDILESNGSSSMASVCGGSMAMMDAGVPLASPVAGIAMGLIMDEATRQVRRPERHRRRRGSLRRHGLQGRRHQQGHHRAADGHQGRPASRRRSCARRWTRRARAGSLILGKMAEDRPAAARHTSRPSRRASSPSRSRSTRSATSSDRAAR